MTQLEFIRQISWHCQKLAKKYGYKVASPAIAQACLQSAYGTSNKAKHNNFFGLKYRPNRVYCHNGVFADGSAEQNADGSYRNITDTWYNFDTMEAGVQGYYQFIAGSRYDKVRTAATALEYLNQIKAAGYATSHDYVKNVYAVITKWNLTQYDTINGENNNMTYTNSPLVNYTKLSPNKTPDRNHKIDTITIHHMAGNLTVESCGEVFASPSRKASSNYGIGTDGRIGLYVEEKDRSWCSSNADNDHRAVTIEVANNTLGPNWTISAAAMNSLIKLCADICKRNNIPKLLYKNDPNLIGQVDKQNITKHKWFSKTLCPGPYIEAQLDYIVQEVNKLLGHITPVAPVAPVQPATPINSQWSVQIGAYRDKRNAENMLKIITGFGYKAEIVTDNSLFKVRVAPVNTITEVNSIYVDLKGKGYQGLIVEIKNQNNHYLVKINTTSLNYRTGPGVTYPIKGTVKRGEIYTIVKEQNGWGYLKSGAGWIKLSYTVRV